MGELQASGIDFEFVQRKGMKNIRIAVLPPDGHVRVSAPIGAGPALARSFVSARAGWIREKQARFASLPQREPRGFVSGEHCTIWDEDTLLEVAVGGSRGSATLDGGKLLMEVPASWCSDRRRELFEGFLHGELEDRLEEAIPRAERKTGLRAESYSIRRMGTRWGSCTPEKGTIRIALRLAEYPPECLDMVLVHELGHLEYPDHGDGFKAHMDRCCPDWRRIRQELV